MQAAGTSSTGRIRHAELLVGLSAVADLGMGQPVGSAARTCLVAVAVCRAAGCDEQAASDVFFASLLQHVGCTAYSHEASLLFADELSVKRAAVTTDFSRPREVALGYLPTIVRDAPPGQRVRTARSALLHGASLADGYSRANCEVASVVARRLGLPPGVGDGLLDVFESWDGRGRPRGLRGEQISLVARTVTVAGVAALFDRLGGPYAAADAVRRRAGRQLDPALADAFVRLSNDVLSELETADASDVLRRVEPRPVREISYGAVEDVLRAFGDTVDLKAPFLHGHATEVARLTRSAAQALRLPAGDVRDAERAALVHDIGRVAVPTAVWERPGALGTDSWERVRLHAYHSEQILARCPPLTRLARIAGMHHERLDGSGYHRSASAAHIPMAARILAAADTFQAMTSARPHRPALHRERAADELRAMATAGRLDADAAHAVIAAASGKRVAPSRGGRPHRAPGRGPAPSVRGIVQPLHR